MRKVLVILSLLATVSFVAMAADLEAAHSCYAIRDGQPLLADKDPDSKTVAKLKSHHEYDVVKISGKWAQIKAGDNTGWVYVGNLSRDEPPDVNTSSMSTQASATTLSAAARGIDDDAKSYANRKGEAESGNDVVWMEQENDAIRKADVKAYMQEHKLGDYAGGK